MPNLGGILESSIYVDNLNRSVEFYQSIFQWQAMERDDRLCAFNVSGRQVFLVFRRGGTVNSINTESGVIPGHDGSGQTNVAFSIAQSDLSKWEAWLREKGVTIESQKEWPGGGQSLYFRDPDGHLLELATPGTWSIY